MKSLKINLDLRQWFTAINTLDLVAVRWHKCERDITLSFYLIGIGIIIQHTYKSNIIDKVD